MPTPENVRNLADTLRGQARQERLTDNRSTLFEAADKLREYADCLERVPVLQGGPPLSEEEHADRTVEEDEPELGPYTPLTLARWIEQMREYTQEHTVNWYPHRNRLRSVRALVRQRAPEDGASSLTRGLTALIVNRPDHIEDLDGLLSAARDCLTQGVPAAMDMSAIRPGGSVVRPDHVRSRDSAQWGTVTGRWSSDRDNRTNAPRTPLRPRRALDLRDPEEPPRAPAEIDSGQPSEVGTLGTPPDAFATARILAQSENVRRMLGWSEDEAQRINLSFPNTSEVIYLAAHIDRLEGLLRTFAEAPINHDGGAFLKRLIREELGTNDGDQ